ncbi:MAG: hypothetical protein HOQ02_10920 [Lysobacter sp.]|nr:hypothetical protein [Lysobacter sp.]
MLKHIGPREIIAALGLASTGAGVALINLPAALVAVGVVLFFLAVPPRHFVR